MHLSKVFLHVVVYVVVDCSVVAIVVLLVNATVVSYGNPPSPSHLPVRGFSVVADVVVVSTGGVARVVPIISAI